MSDQYREMAERIFQKVYPHPTPSAEQGRGWFLKIVSREMEYQIALRHDASTEAALAYADGHLAALNECEREDVGELIKERNTAQCEAAFHRARADVAERRLAEWKEDRARQAIAEEAG